MIHLTAVILFMHTDSFVYNRNILDNVILLIYFELFVCIESIFVFELFMQADSFTIFEVFNICNSLN